MLAQKIIETVTGFISLQDFAGSASVNVPGNDTESASNTVGVVRDVCSPEAQKRLKLDVSSFVLICSSDDVIDDIGVKFVRDLAVAARAAAPSHACSSVLAGHASESDEYADIGLLFGAGTLTIDPADGSLEKNARAVLSSLGLNSMISVKVMPLPLSEETCTPVTFKASVQDADVQRLTSLLVRLSHRFAFSVPLNGVVFHFLLGQLAGDDSWLGLMGLGTWSD